MAEKVKKVAIQLSLDVDKQGAIAQVKGVTESIKKMMSNVEKSGGAFEIFQDLVGYLGQVEDKILELKGINLDKFNELFGEDGGAALNTALQSQLSKFIETAQQIPGIIDSIQKKIHALSTQESVGIKDIRAVGSDIKALYALIGKTPEVDLDFANQKGSIKKLEILSGALKDFQVNWVEFANTIKGKSNPLSSSDNDGGVERTIQAKIDQLKKQKQEFQEVIDAIDQKPLQLKLDKENDANELKRLLDEYKNVNSKINNSIVFNNLSFEEQNKLLAERIRLAALLRRANNYIVNEDNGSEEAYDLATMAYGYKIISSAENVLNDFYENSKGKAEQIKKLFSGLISNIDEELNKLQPQEPQDKELKQKLQEYDVLQKKIQEYYDLQKKLKTVDENSPESEQIKNRQREIQDEIYGMKELKEEQEDIFYALFDRIDEEDDIQLNDAIRQFCNILEIDIPNAANQAANAASSAFFKITKEANDAGKEAKKVMYHLGNLLDGNGKAKDTFGDMAENLTTMAEGTKYEKYGFGVLGGGLFGVVDPSTITQKPGKSNFIQSIDLSKYNMYMADTEERATALMDFLSKLQKFSIKSAEPNYTGFDQSLHNVDINSLYNQFKVVFDQSELTKEQFKEFINEMVVLLKQAGIEFDSKTGELSFSNISDELYDSENISTRFLKMLGFNGVNTGTTSFGGLGQGSVLFDFDKIDIVGYFESVESAVHDYERVVNQINGNEWVGTTEQLKQYGSNIDAIIDKLQQYKDSGILKDTTQLDRTLEKLTQIRQNINDILSGKDISGNSPFETITTSAEQAADSLESTMDSSDVISENAKAIQSWEELCAVVERYNELCRKKFSENSLTNEEMLELERISDRFAVTKGVSEDPDKLLNHIMALERSASVMGEYNIDKLAEYFGIEIPKYVGELKNIKNVIANYNSHGFEIYDGGSSRVALDEMYALENKLGQLFEGGFINEEEFDRLNQEVQSCISTLQDLAGAYDALNELKDSSERAGLTDNVQELEDIIEKRKVLLGGLEDYGSLPSAVEEERKITEQIQKRVDLQKQLADEKIASIDNMYHETLSGKEYSDIEIGTARERINGLTADLEKLASQGAVTAEQLEMSKDKIKYIGEELYLQEDRNSENRYYDYGGYSYTYESEYIEAQNELDLANNEIKRLEERLSEPDKKAESIAIDEELSQLEQLSSKLVEVKNAVDAKTNAFEEEYVTVDAAINAEIQSLQLLLNKLQEVYSMINSIQQSFSQINSQIAQLDNIGDINVKGGTTSKASAVKAKEVINKQYALDSTLVSTNNILSDILAAINKSNDENNIKSLDTLVSALTANITTLKDAANGIIEEKKARKISTSEANARIADTDQYAQIRDVALNSLGERAVDSKVTDMKALANGLVQVSGYIKTAEGNYENFIVKINSANEAIGLTFKENQKLTKAMHQLELHKDEETVPRKTTKETQKEAYEWFSSLYLNNARANQTANIRFSDDNKNFTVDLKEDFGGILRDTFITYVNKAVQDELGNISYEVVGTRSTVSFNDKQFAQLRAQNNMIDASSLIDHDGIQYTSYSNAYNEYLALLERIRASLEAGKEVNETDLVLISQKANEVKNLGSALQAVIKKQQLVNAGFKSENGGSKSKQKTPDNSVYGSQQMLSAAARYNSLQASVNDGYSNSEVIAKAWEKYSIAFKAMSDAQANFTAGENRDTSDFKQKVELFKTLQLNCNKYARELNNLITSSEKLKMTGDEHSLENTNYDLTSAQDRAKALRDVVQEASEGQAVIGNFGKNFTELYYTIQNGDGTITQMTAKLNAARTAIVTTAGATKEAKGFFGSFFDELKSKGRSIATYLISMAGFQEVWQQLRQGVQYVREIDSALTELKKVTDETDATYNKFLKNMANSAGAIGTTVKDLTSSAADWARLGYSLEDAGDLAATTAKLLNISEFTSIEDATSALVSSLQAFADDGKDASVRAEEIVDILNHIGNRYPVATNELAEGLAASGAALVAANNSIEEQVALLSAGNATMQDVSTVAAGLKIVAARLRGTTTEADDDAESAVTNVSKLQEKIKALTAEANGGEGIDIINEQGEYKSTYEILSEISKIFDKMDDVSQASLLELIAGKNRSSVVAAILQNGDILDKAYADAFNSSGSAAKELETSLDSIEGRISQFQNSLQTFWMNLIDSSVVKDIVQLGTGILDLVNNAGALKTVLVSLTGFEVFKVLLPQVGNLVTGFGLLIEESYKTGRSIADINKEFGILSLKTELANSALIKNAITNNVLTEAQVASATTTQLLGMSFDILKAKVIAAGKAMFAFVAANPWIAVAAVAVGAIVALTAAIETQEEKIERLKNEWDELQSSISNIESEINTLNSKLKETQTQIDALEGKTLSFVEQEELDRLKAQSAELERQKSIQEALLETKKSRNNIISTELVQDMFENNAAGQKEAKEAGKSWGKTIGFAIGSALAVGAIALTGGLAAIPVGAGAATLGAGAATGAQIIAGLGITTAVGAAGAGVGNIVGGEIGNNSKKTSNAIEWYESYAKELEDAEEELKDAEKKFFGDRTDDNYDAWQKKEEEVAKIQETFYGHLQEMQQYVANTEYTEETKDTIDSVNLLLDKFAIKQGSKNAKSNFLNRIFGDNASATIKKAKEEINSIVNDTSKTMAEKSDEISEILNRTGSEYDYLRKQVESAGMKMGEVLDYFTKVGEFSPANTTFSLRGFLTDNEERIDAIQSSISSYQSALDSLEGGTFTFSDFVDLIQQFPELAEGVDTSSDSFEGLSKNLRKAIKNAPKTLVKELKKLREELKATGKSTDAIDQMIDSIENLPIEAVDSLAQKYGTLADEIDSATQAQNKLAESLDQDTNQGYQTRAEAWEKMVELFKVGAIGSESNLWNIAKNFFGDNPEALASIANKDADALWKLVEAREKWYTLGDDGAYTYDGIESFIKYVAGQTDAIEKFGATWTYADGVFNFDLNNEQWEEFAHALGLSADEFSDLMVQAGQFFKINWTTASDYEKHLDAVNQKIEEIASDKTLTAKQRLEKINEVMQDEYGIGDVDLTTRPEVTFDENSFGEWKKYYQGIVDNAKQYSEEYVEFAKSQISAINAGDSSATVYSSTYYKSDFGELKPGETDAAIVLTPILPNNEVLSPEELEQYAKQLLYGEKIDIGDDITLGLFEGEDFKEKAAAFSENLHKAQEAWLEVSNAVKANPLDLSFDNPEELFKQLSGYKIDVSLDGGNLEIKNLPQLEKLLADNGYSSERISEIFAVLVDGTNDKVNDFINSINEIGNVSGVCEEATTALQNLGIAYTQDTNSLGEPVSIVIDSSDIDKALVNLGYTEERIAQIKQQWEASGITINVDANTSDAETGVFGIPVAEDQTFTVKISNYNQIISDIDTIDKKKIGNKTYTVTQVVKTMFGGVGFGEVNGTAHVNGTAYAGGSWGATKTETALTGELGPELRVRDGRWELLGENGAEFADIKRGDIIFNHRQTESLLKNGYVTSRGKAYAEGTAFASGNSAYKTYSLSSSSNAKGKDGSNNDKDTSEQSIDFIEYLLEEIENIISKTSAKIENFLDDTTDTLNKNNYYGNLVDAEKDKAQAYLNAQNLYSQKADDLLAKIPAEYREMAKNGAIAIYDFIGETESANAEAIEEYREWAQKADEAEISYLESIAQISAYRLEQLQDIADDFENVIGLVESRSSMIEAGMDLITESGGRLSEQYYKELIKNTQEKEKKLTKEKEELQKILDESVRTGEVQVGSDDWYEMVNAITDIDMSIIECRTDIEGFQNDINDLKWDNLDKFVKELDNVDSQLSHLFDLLSDDDKVVDEMGNWTDEGVTSLGLLAQQMELAQYKSKQYGDAIEQLKSDYAAGLYSEDEYNEKLAELTENQWESIEAYESAKDAIVSLNKVRVEAVKNAINKEIDAYEKLIDAKKEALQTDKEAHDFEKSVAEKQKDVATIQKQLAALANDQSAAATAKKKQLQADLLDAQGELEELYYDHSIDNQQTALDKELENYKNNKQAEMDALDEWVKNTNLVITESLNMVQAQTNTVLATILDTANAYGVNISSAVTQPWKDGNTAIGDYKIAFSDATSGFITELDRVKESQNALADNAKTVADRMISEFNRAQQEIQRASQQISTIPTTPNTGGTIGSVGTSSSGSSGGGGGSGSGGSSGGSSGSESVRALQRHLGVTADGIWGPVTSAALSKKREDLQYMIKATQNEIRMVPLNEKEKYQGYLKNYQNQLATLNSLAAAAGYAKGTLGVSKDQLAFIDELGEELVLHAGPNGRLQYLTKGTSVIPADLTEKLMNLAVDPTSALDASRPSIGAPQLINNNFEINLEFGSLVHVDNCNQDTIPELKKMVHTEFDAMMRQLNNRLYGKIR